MSKAFRFSTPLDSEILESFYDGDLSYALMMMEVCLEQMPLEVESLLAGLNSRSLEGCRKILHKIKPTFTMVGNDPLSQEITLVERRIASGTVQLDDVEKQILDIIDEIRETLVLLEQETNNLKRFLNS